VAQTQLRVDRMKVRVEESVKIEEMVSFRKKQESKLSTSTHFVARSELGSVSS
jgi:hypothetical protein